jgi:hypothetical protein
MSITPEYGEEKLLGQDEAGVFPRPGPGPEVDHLGEREIQERKLEERELLYLDPEENELRAPGQICERCGQIITATQDVRRLLDGHFIHEVCPGHPGV